MGEGFYKILSLPKNATLQEIKQAYRNLVHHLHPDKIAGDEEKFREATDAYKILIDPIKREEYDLTGYATLSQKEIASKAHGIIESVFEQLYTQAAEKLKYIDVVNTIKQAISDGIEKSEEKLIEQKNEIERISDTLDRVESRAPVNIIKISLEAKEKAIKKQIYINQMDLKAAKKAYDMIKDYSFRSDRQPIPQNHASFFSTTIADTW